LCFFRKPEREFQMRSECRRICQRRISVKKRFSTNAGVSTKRFIQSLWMVIAVALIGAWLFIGCSQQNSNKPVDFINLERVRNKVAPATVYIEVIHRTEPSDGMPSFAADPFFHQYSDVDALKIKLRDDLGGQGTGMIIDSEGHVLTNYHVVRGADTLEVRLSNGRWCPAKVIGTDPETDLAMIRIVDQLPLPHITFGSINSLAADEPVATIGYAKRIRNIPRPRLMPTAFGGRIITIQSNGMVYCSACPEFWTSDAGNNSGNSGALLLNRQGEVVGVGVAIVTQPNEPKTIGFAIPSNTAARIAAQLISNE